MKILIIGIGVVGTIYGWALSQAGADITHVVRKGKKAKFKNGVQLDVLDLRKGHPETQRTVYQPKIVEDVTPQDGYDLVIVPTKHYQLADAVREFKDKTPSSTFLMFTANWEGTQAIDQLIPRSKYLWGYSVSSGGHLDGVTFINVRSEIRIGELDGTRTPRLESIINLFKKADITADVKPNIIEWLWIHHAVNAGTIGTALYAGGLEQLVNNDEMSNYMVYAVLDALKVLEKRGVDVNSYPDTAMFLNQPAEKAILQFKNAFLLSPTGQRNVKAGHFKSNPQEMKQYYLDVLKTGEELGVDMPYLSAMKSKIQAI